MPLPKGATADRFTMTMGGQEVQGEVLDAQKALLEFLLVQPVSRA